MNIPAPSDPRWTELISGKLKCEFELLGTKIIIGRVGIVYKLNPTQETMKKCIDDLINFFVQNQKIPKAQTDLARIFQ